MTSFFDALREVEGLASFSGTQCNGTYEKNILSRGIGGGTVEESLPTEVRTRV